MKEGKAGGRERPRGTKRRQGEKQKGERKEKGDVANPPPPMFPKHRISDVI